ncbi:MAG TPA: hypothetical protein VHI93_01990 [Candidatus Thermoplasmatota archaeon]|nr:hypothetical protein [Candidatus Thermoplasmatota archaeon]
MLDIEKARTELRTSSMAKIERATALTWGARAVASFQMCAEATDWEARLRHFCEGEAYRQEALEHAATGEAWQSLLPALDAEIGMARAAAETAMQFAKPRQKDAR